MSRPVGALLISKDILDDLDITAEILHSGEVTVTDVLASGLVPHAARLTGVMKGAKPNPALDIRPHMTLVGSQSQITDAIEVVGENSQRQQVVVPQASGHQEPSFTELMEELHAADQEEALVSDVVGKMSPNLLAMFGMDLPEGKDAPMSFEGLLNSKVEASADMMSLSDLTSKPFIMLISLREVQADQRTFIAAELTEDQTEFFQKSTLDSLEVSKGRCPSP